MNFKSNVYFSVIIISLLACGSVFAQWRGYQMHFSIVNNTKVGEHSFSHVLTALPFVIPPANGFDSGTAINIKPTAVSGQVGGVAEAYTNKEMSGPDTYGKFKIADSQDTNNYCVIQYGYYQHLIQIFSNPSQDLICSVSKVGGESATVTVTSRINNFTEKSPIVTSTPIITNIRNGDINQYSINYLVNIHSGKLRGYNFTDPFKILEKITPEYFNFFSNYPSHYFLAFMPYKIMDPDNPQVSPNYVIPISAVEEQSNQTSGGLVSFADDTEFMYTGAAKTITVKQSIIKSINKDSTGHTIVNNFSSVSQQVDTSQQPAKATAGFNITNFSFITSVSPSTPEIYANGLQQVPIDVVLRNGNKIISPQDKTYGNLYKHIFFVSCGQDSTCNSYVPITGVFDKDGYSSITSHKGPYAQVLGASLTSNFKQSIGKEFYFSSTIAKSTIYIAPMVCISQDPQSIGQYQDACTPISGDVIPIQTMTQNDNSFQAVATNDATIAFHVGESPFHISPEQNDILISPLTYSVKSDAYSLLGYPLMIGIPEYFVSEAKAPLMPGGGNTLINSDSDFEHAGTATLHLVDQYGNYYFGQLASKPHS